MIFSAKRDGQLEIANMRLQKTYRSVERELFILLIVTTSDLAETRDATNDALRDYGCTCMPAVLFILLRARREVVLGSDGRLRRSICKGQQRMCNAAHMMRVYRPVVAAVKAVWMTGKDEELRC